jgi:pimeloyl-ACP methyl ester carboxylesterase
MSKFIRWLIFLFVAGLIFSSAYQALATSADLKTYPAPGKLIEVRGHRLHIYCMGKGEPTVIMEAGMTGWSTDWVLVQPEVAKVTRVCSYDRAGYGWSDTGPQQRDSQQVATELHTLLTKTGIQGKIILVGHSLGGLFAQYYARTYPQQVAGLVLVDSVHPEQSLRMEESDRERYEGNLQTLTLLSQILAPTGLLRLAHQSETVIADKLPGEYQSMVRSVGYQSKAYRALHAEMASFQQSQAEVRDAGPLPDLPLVVISSAIVRDFPPGFSGDSMKRVWDDLQRDLSESATLPHVVAQNSGHYVHMDQPELVIQSVLKIVDLVRRK